MTADLSTPSTTGHESLAAAGLGHVYGVGTPEEHRALDGITFSIDRGEFVAIVGPSGCGKTTLLRCLSGLMTADVRVGRPSTACRSSSVPEDLTLVFQDYRRSLYPWLRVDANVEFPLRYSGIDKRERAERVRQALDDVGLTGHGRKYPGQLSGGMQQTRVDRPRPRLSAAPVVDGRTVRVGRRADPRLAGGSPARRVGTAGQDGAVRHARHRRESCTWPTGSSSCRTPRRG